MNDNEALDDAKRRFLSAKADIDGLRQKIAESSCPLSVGDRVVVRDGDKTYDGIIDHIGAAPELGDLIELKVGAPTPWAASGKRIRKADGASPSPPTPSTWTAFGIYRNAQSSAHWASNKCAHKLSVSLPDL